MTDPIQDEWNALVRQSRKTPAPRISDELPKPTPDKPPRKWALPTLLALSLAALALHYKGILLPPPAAPSPQELKAGQDAALEVVARAIHDYATFHGQYPRKVSEVLPLTLDVDYRLTPDGFELRTTGADGIPIVIRGK